MSKGRLLSGIQPTGSVHLGNYLGALKQWVTIQDEYESLFCIVDLHAITNRFDPAALQETSRLTAAIYLACGIDPQKATIFCQSAVSAHTELAWILACMTPLGWLNRMTQFKEKAGKHRENASLGLYGYPVLMAADILLYKSTHVPVGDDQKQHLELTRDIAQSFNHTFKQDYFPEVEPLIPAQVSRIMSLRDATCKMSKSDVSEYSRINLLDDADTIQLKFRKAKSDGLEGVTYEPEKRPEASNLLAIYSGLTNQSIETLQEQYIGLGFQQLKQDLAEVVIAHLEPIRTETNRIVKDVSYLDDVLKEGAGKARLLASKHLNEIKDMVGFLPSSHD
jgi:tryptophanyl-tRNA synthetase